MFRWFRRILPREDTFFVLFDRHARTVQQGAEALRAMLEGGDAVARHYPAVLAREDEADEITRQVVAAVRRTFITPFDRGDIQALIGRMDDSVDQMKKTAKAIALFEMRDFPDDLRQIADCALRCAGLLVEVTPLLANISAESGRINALCEEIRRLEGEADDVHDSGVTALYRRCALESSAMPFIAQSQVFDQMERVVDRFDDVANAIEGIVVEHV